jgi:hypothetical protein
MITIYGNTSYEGDHHLENLAFKLELTEERVEYMKELAAEVERLEVYELSLFDYRIEVFETCFDDVEEAKEYIAKEDDFTIIYCCLLHVTQEGFRYTAALKHDYHTFSTGFIYFSELKGQTEVFAE